MEGEENMEEKMKTRQKVRNNGSEEGKKREACAPQLGVAPARRS